MPLGTIHALYNRTKTVSKTSVVITRLKNVGFHFGFKVHDVIVRAFRRNTADKGKKICIPRVACKMELETTQRVIVTHVRNTNVCVFTSSHSQSFGEPVVDGRVSILVRDPLAAHIRRRLRCRR